MVEYPGSRKPHTKSAAVPGVDLRAAERRGIVRFCSRGIAGRDRALKLDEVRYSASRYDVYSTIDADRRGDESIVEQREHSFRDLFLAARGRGEWLFHRFRLRLGQSPAGATIGLERFA